ncbi:MAG: SDR family oxidoreductase [Pseudomonadota bacterium]
MTTLSGKKALVLGGSRGIGAAIVKQLREEGAEVTFTYANSEAPAQNLAAQTGANAVRADSANRDEIIQAVSNAGALDIIVANAGVIAMGDPLELDPDAVDHLIDVNVRAPYHAFVEAGRKMNDNGRMIVIGSVNADRIPFPGAAAYSLSKSALQGMVRGLARDFGARGITVNSVQPGPVDTDMNPADGPMRDAMHSFMAIKRHARADEVAGLVAYLAGSKADMITGSLQTIDGGFGA